MTDLDKIDELILYTLQQDGRLSTVDLAKRVGLSSTPCGRRVKRLQNDGFIERYAAVVSPQRLGLRLNAFVDVRLKTSASEAIESFVAAIERMPQVIDAYFVTGNYDFLLHVRVEGVEAFTNFVRKELLNIPNIGETHSSIALEQIKRTTVFSVASKPLAAVSRKTKKQQ